MQLATICEMWKADSKYNPEGKQLWETIESELSGDFKDGVMMLVKGQARLDAEVLYDAIVGIGTDEERLNEILTGRHPGQIELIKKEYLKLEQNQENQETLWDAVCADTTFKYERFLKSMLDPAGFLAFLCYEAMHGNRYDFTGITGIGTNEDMLIRVLLSVNRDNDGVKSVLKMYDDNFDIGWKEELERLAHQPDIEDIKACYPRLEALGFAVNGGNEDTKQKAANEWDPVNNGPDGSNPYRRDGTFFFCAQPKNAKEDWEEYSVQGGNKIWTHLTYFWVSPRAPHPDFREYIMPPSYRCYVIPMGRSLSRSIDEDMFFDQMYKGFKDVLLWLLKDKDVGGAIAINESFGGATVCKDTIMAVMASRSNSQRTAIAQKYEKLYGNKQWAPGLPLHKLQDDIKEKLSGEFGEVAGDMFQDGDERAADYCFLAMHGHNKDDALAAKGIEISGSKQDGVVQQSETFFRSGMIGSLGTDEQRLNRVILYSNKSELKGLSEAYKTKFGGYNPRTKRTDPTRQIENVGPTLFDDVFSETGSDYRRLLMYRFHQAKSGFIHVPRGKIIRKDDMPSNFPIDAIAKYELRKDVKDSGTGVDAADIESNVLPED